MTSQVLFRKAPREAFGSSLSNPIRIDPRIGVFAPQILRKDRTLGTIKVHRRRDRRRENKARNFRSTPYAIDNIFRSMHRNVNDLALGILGGELDHRRRVDQSIATFQDRIESPRLHDIRAKNFETPLVAQTKFI